VGAAGRSATALRGRWWPPQRRARRAVRRGLISVTPDAGLVDAYRGAGGDGPRLAQVHVCLAATIDEAEQTAWAWWPNGRIAPAVLPELSRPGHFAAVAATTVRDAIHETVVCATDAAPILATIDRYAGAGFDTIYLHQIGPDQRRLLDVARRELLPHHRSAP
jgi:hypothetical protein